MDVRIARPASTLEENLDNIRAVLGRDLPEAVAAFYAESDGMTVKVVREGVELPDYEGVVASLEDAFDGWKTHGQAADSAEFTDASYDEAFCEITWSPDADVDEPEALAQMNAIRRSKLLMSIPGAPEFLVIDHTGSDGVAKIGWAYEGSEFHPLDLEFGEFLRLVQLFGAARWYWAFLPAQVDHRKEVQNALKDFVGTYPDEVAALVRRAGPQRSQ